MYMVRDFRDAFLSTVVKKYHVNLLSKCLTKSSLYFAKRRFSLCLFGQSGYQFSTSFYCWEKTILAFV